MNIKPYTAICDAIVTLFDPLAEVVIHDVRRNTICYIAGTLSGRKIGDPSLLDIDPKDPHVKLDQVAYPKTNFDGRLIKSISVPLKEKNTVCAIMCINCDVTLFGHMQRLADTLLPSLDAPKPEALFNDDWQDRLHLVIHDELRDRNWVFSELTNRQKKVLVHQLFIKGAFNEKKAADYIAERLNMGRATVFNYLREWRS